jgi:hypothetical protein
MIQSNPVEQGERDAVNDYVDMIASVDSIASDICGRTEQMRKILDAIDQQVRQSAAQSKQSLNDHVVTCVRLSDEVQRMRGVVAELTARRP